MFRLCPLIVDFCPFYGVTPGGGGDDADTEIALSKLDPEADDIGGDAGAGDDVLTRMDQEPGKSFDGEEGDLVDRDVNDLGKAYGDDVEGVRGSAKITTLVCEP